MKKRLLWLDDMRDPKDPQMDWLKFSPIGRDVDVSWVKSYKEFVSWIIKNGLPDAICFDHDLGKEVEKELLTKGYSKKDARSLKSEEKTGYDAAKWLVGYCMDNDKDLPEFAIQSSNPVGKENISKLFDSFRRFKNKK